MSSQTQSQREAERRREEQDRNSTAFQAGEAPRMKPPESLPPQGAKLDEGTRKAREGWQEDSRKREEPRPR